MKKKEGTCQVANGDYPEESGKREERSEMNHEQPYLRRHSADRTKASDMASSPDCCSHCGSRAGEDEKRTQQQTTERWYGCLCPLVGSRAHIPFVVCGVRRCLLPFHLLGDQQYLCGSLDSHMVCCSLPYPWSTVRCLVSQGDLFLYSTTMSNPIAFVHSSHSASNDHLVQAPWRPACARARFPPLFALVYPGLQLCLRNGYICSNHFPNPIPKVKIKLDRVQ